MALACITGASSGIGEEFAVQLAKRGYDLILVARNEVKLTRLAKELNAAHGVACEVWVHDLSLLSSCKQLAAALKDRRPYLFINNAGFGDIGYFHKTNPETDLRMIDVNVRALHYLTKAVLRDMVARDKGYLLNVASAAGLMDGGPLMATYYATKSYVVSLTSSIAQELKMARSNVRISALCPGPVDTNFNDTAGVRFAIPGLTASKCVSSCLKQMNRGKLIIVPGTAVRAGSALLHFVPRSVQLAYAANVQRAKMTTAETPAEQ